MPFCDATPYARAQLGGQALQCTYGLPVLGDPAGLKEDPGAVVFALQCQLIIPRSACHCPQFLGDGQPLGRIVRTVDTGSPVGERVSQRLAAAKGDSFQAVLGGQQPDHLLPGTAGLPSA